jgi:hypothetical protein
MVSPPLDAADAGEGAGARPLVLKCMGKATLATWQFPAEAATQRLRPRTTSSRVAAWTSPAVQRTSAVAGGWGMSATNEAVATDRRVMLSTLWIFAILNYAYADILGLFFNPVLQKEEHERILSGYVGDIRITQGFVLIGALLMETAIVMVLLSRVLPYSANRWANILAGLLHTGSVVWSLTGGSVNVFYVFFATIEIACTLFIVWYAWSWRSPAPSATPVSELRQPTGSGS